MTLICLKTISEVDGREVIMYGRHGYATEQVPKRGKLVRRQLYFVLSLCLVRCILVIVPLSLHLRTGVHCIIKFSLICAIVLLHG